MLPIDAIYLDHNATAPMLPEVADAVREASLRYHGNPASQHAAGREARRALAAARERIGELLGCAASDQVIFTSGGTEANNLVLAGLAGWPRQNPRPSVNDPPGGRTLPAVPATVAPEQVIVSGLEHPSVTLAAEQLRFRGWQVGQLTASEDGVVNEGFFDLLGPTTRLVSIMLANNETGVLQPVAKIAAKCRERGVLIHTDAVQAVGKIPVDFRALGVDALTLTAHKFHGPVGIGGLIVRHGVHLWPQLHGGFQQGGSRPGTECVALAIGMCAALEAWAQEADARRDRLLAMRRSLESQLLAGDPQAVIIGRDAPRLPHTSNIAFTGLDRQALAMALDLAGVACSTGSACASGSSEPSPAFTAMGLPARQISSSLRFSLGATTTAAEIDEAARRILSVINHLRRR